MPDAMAYSGLVVLKMPKDQPVTDYPVIYSFVKLMSAKHTKINTKSAMKIQEYVLSRVDGTHETDTYGYPLPLRGGGWKYEKLFVFHCVLLRSHVPSHPPPLIISHHTTHHYYLHRLGDVLNRILDQADTNKAPKKASEEIKPAGYYSRMAQQAWKSFHKELDEEVRVSVICIHTYIHR